MRELLESAAARAIRYLEGIGERSVAPSAEAVAHLSRFDEPLPVGPSAPAETLALLDEAGSPATIGIAGPRFFGFVTGGALPVTVGANWLATAWDQNSVFATITPGVARIEAVALRWLLDLFGLPGDAAGAFVTGATVANFTALAAARHAVLARAGWDVEADGLFGAPPIMVITGEEAHPTLYKSLGMLGLGRERVVRVPVDAQGRMRPDALPLLEPPAILCLQAGNVNSGAFDPFTPLCDAARAAGAWVHVDGAFGLWAAASPQHQHLTAGIERADSWATDAHKWLNVPYDSGIAFVRDREALRRAMAISAAYLPDEGAHGDPSDYTPELSRRARGVEVWAALRTLGRAGVADLIDRCCAHATRAAAALDAAGFEILNTVVLNQVVVAVGDEETTRRTVMAIHSDGTCWCGPTRWHDRPAIRISVSGWNTTTADIDRSLQAILRAAMAARGDGSGDAGDLR